MWATGRAQRSLAGFRCIFISRLSRLLLLNYIRWGNLRCHRHVGDVRNLRWIGSHFERIAWRRALGYDESLLEFQVRQRVLNFRVLARRHQHVIAGEERQSHRGLLRSPRLLCGKNVDGHVLKY